MPTKAWLARELRATRRALQRSEHERARLLETLHVFAMSKVKPPMGARAFALAIGEPSWTDVSRFLRNKLGSRAYARVRPKVEVWLAAKFTDTAPEYSLDAIRTLSAHSLLDLLFWSHSVERPRTARSR